MHVDNFQEHHFLEIKKSNAENHTGLGWWGNWGIGGGGVGYTGGRGMISSRYSRPLLIANALTQIPYYKYH